MSDIKKRCHAQQHMSCAEFGLWEQYRKLSFASGQLFEATENTASRFTGESRSSIYRLRAKLIQKGWLVISKKSKPGENGRHRPTIFRVIDHEEWVRKHGKADCNLSSWAELQPVPEMESGAKLPVPEMKSPSSKSETDPVPKVEHRFEENQFESKSRFEDSGPVGFEKKDSQSGAEVNAERHEVAPVPKVKLEQQSPVPELKPAARRTVADILKLLPKARAKWLFTRTGGNYGLPDAEAELAAWQAEQAVQTSQQ
jgi:hypothetical protein